MDTCLEVSLLAVYILGAILFSRAVKTHNQKISRPYRFGVKVVIFWPLVVVVVALLYPLHALDKWVKS